MIVFYPLGSRNGGSIAVGGAWATWAEVRRLQQPAAGGEHAGNGGSRQGRLVCAISGRAGPGLAGAGGAFWRGGPGGGSGQAVPPAPSVVVGGPARVGDAPPRRVHSRRARAAGRGLRARRDKLLLVPEGQRRWELDLWRRPPFTPTITGLVRALDRLER